MKDQYWIMWEIAYFNQFFLETTLENLFGGVYGKHKSVYPSE